MGPLAAVRSYNTRLTRWAESHPIRWYGLMLVFGTALMMLLLSVTIGGPLRDNLGYALAFGVFFGFLQVLFLRIVDT